VELWEDINRMETILPPKINYYRSQRKMKKPDTQIQIPTKQI
jgi:hypothetical protein